MMKKILIFSILFLLVIGFVSATPLIPMSFSGNVNINGNAAPINTAIVAKINNVTRGSCSTTTAGYYGGVDHYLLVSGTDADVGGTIHFSINGYPAIQTSTFVPDQMVNLGLSVSGVIPTPTPTVSPTPTFTPTPTTTPTPSPTQTPTPTPTPVPGVLKAGFTADPKSGVLPLVVSFQDLSTGSPTSWSWAFGDGSTSIERNPVHTYVNAGIYSVKLKVSNAAGANGLSRSSYITVSSGPAPGPTPTVSPTPTFTPTPTPTPTPSPTQTPTPTPTPVPGVLKAGFTGDPKTGVLPLVVSFQDLSTGSPTSWSWAFGDGSTSIERNPVHTYLNAGIYSVKLKVSNAAGANGLSRSSYIIVSNSPIPTLTPSGLWELISSMSGQVMQ